MRGWSRTSGRIAGDGAELKSARSGTTAKSEANELKKPRGMMSNDGLAFRSLPTRSSADGSESWPFSAPIEPNNSSPCKKSPGISAAASVCF